jgi:hypothetical protein
MSISLDNFKASGRGQKLSPLIEDPKTICEMKVLSKHKIPAIQAIGAAITALGWDLDDTAKKFVGKWVREVMEGAGLVLISERGRVAPGNTFKYGAIYGCRM